MIAGGEDRYGDMEWERPSRCESEWAGGRERELEKESRRMVKETLGPRDEDAHVVLGRTYIAQKRHCGHCVLLG